jgi:hypothetical protein
MAIEISATRWLCNYFETGNIPGETWQVLSSGEMLILPEMPRVVGENTNNGGEHRFQGPVLHYNARCNR